jgi:hypothetical protein
LCDRKLPGCWFTASFEIDSQREAKQTFNHLPSVSHSKNRRKLRVLRCIRC